MGNLPLEELSVVGITEEFNRSIALFNATLGRNLKATLSANTNPDRTTKEYPVEPEVMDLVNRYRAQDMDLYQSALKGFETQCARLGL